MPLQFNTDLLDEILGRKKQKGVAELEASNAAPPTGQIPRQAEEGIRESGYLEVPGLHEAKKAAAAKLREMQPNMAVMGEGIEAIPEDADDILALAKKPAVVAGGYLKAAAGKVLKDKESQLAKDINGKVKVRSNPSEGPALDYSKMGSRGPTEPPAVYQDLSKVGKNLSPEEFQELMRRKMKNETGSLPRRSMKSEY